MPTYIINGKIVVIVDGSGTSGTIKGKGRDVTSVNVGDIVTFNENSGETIVYQDKTFKILLPTELT